MEIKRYFLLLLLGLLAGVGCRHSQAMGLQQHALSQPVRTGLERPSMNRAFLSDAPYRKLLIEIDYDERDPPSRHAVNVLRKWLERHVAKPDGIRIVIGDEIPRSRFRPDRASLVEIAREHASGPPDDDTYYVYVLYAPRYGKYRGIAWRAGGLSGDMPFPVVGMMNKQLRIDSFLWLTRRKVEAAVLVHEFGHVAGLGNEGSILEFFILCFELGDALRQLLDGGLGLGLDSHDGCPSVVMVEGVNSVANNRSWSTPACTSAWRP